MRRNRIRKQAADGIGMELVSLIFQRIDLDDILLDLFGFLEVGKFLQQLIENGAGVHDQLGKFQGFGTHFIDVEHIDLADDILHGVYHVIQLLGQCGDIFAFDRRHEFSG